MIKRELLLNKNIFLIFSLIIFCMIVGVSFIYPSIIDSNANIDEMIKVFPKEFLEAFNMDIISLSKFFGWLATEGYLFLQLLSGSLFAIIGSTILLKEKSDHTIDFLAVKPITKNKIITNKLLSGIIYILIFTILTFISVLIGLQINNEMNLKNCLFISINIMLLNLFIYILSFFISLFFKKTTLGISAGIGILMFMYLLNILATLSKKLKYLKYFSIFYYTDSKIIVLDNKLDLCNISVILLSSIIVCILSYILYNKQETGI